MKTLTKNRFERDILKVIVLIGLIRFIFALVIKLPLEQTLENLWLDFATTAVFAMGFLFLWKQVRDRWIISLFIIPLILLLWASFYFDNGLASAGEINAFAVVIILCLTLQGRLPALFVSILLLGACVVLFIVEQDNLASLSSIKYDTSTTPLLIATLANVWMTFHAKRSFDHGKIRLDIARRELLERGEEITSKKATLVAQNEKLTLLRNDLEAKVIERKKTLEKQKKSIEEHNRLSLIELNKPYQKTLDEIYKLDKDSSDDPMTNMIIESGKKMEQEVEKLKLKLLTPNE